MTEPNCDTLHRNLRGGTPGRLLDVIVESLHAMAQPLTVLQATLELAAENPPSLGNYQRAIGESLVQVTRVVEQMGFAQELLRISQYEPIFETVDVRTVLAVVNEDLRCALHDAGIGLETSIEQEIPAVVGSTSALRQCLFYLVLAALRHSSTGQKIKVDVRCRCEEVSILVYAESYPPENSSRVVNSGIPLASGDRSVVFAEALAIVQGGKLEIGPFPFAARLTLRSACAKKVEAERVGAEPNLVLTVASGAGADPLGPGRV